MSRRAYAEGLRVKFPGLVIWHKDKALPYYVENSVRNLEGIPGKLRGDRLPNGVTLALDVDGRLSADKVPMATHWREPLQYGFHDPRGILTRDAQVDHLAVRDLMRLRAGDAGYHLPTLDQMLRASARTGVAVAYDIKDVHGFEDVEIWRRAEALARKRGAHLVVMTEQRYGSTPEARDRWEERALARLAAAHKADLPTLLLHRATVDWSEWGPHLDGVKAHTSGISVQARPEHVARLGLGPSTASQFGSGAQDATIRGTVTRVHERQVEA